MKILIVLLAIASQYAPGVMNNTILIKHHLDAGGWFNIYGEEYDKWSIYDDDFTINGYTHMDNFDMMSFLHKIGVDMEKVERECD